MIRKNDLIEAYRQIGVKRGDLMVLQSSYKGIGDFEGGIEGLIEALQELLGKNGTLVMPSYNFTSWIQGRYHDVLETPSEAGQVSEVFRKSRYVVRTEHPMYSLSVWGSLSEELKNHRSAGAFTEESIFKVLLNHNALYTTLGLGEKMPFLPCHFSEVHENVAYRRSKDFGGIYLDENRTAQLMVFNFHVRMNDKNPVYEAHRHFLRQNKVKTHVFKKTELCFSKAHEYHNLFLKYINDYPELFEL